MRTRTRHPSPLPRTATAPLLGAATLLSAACAQPAPTAPASAPAGRVAASAAAPSAAVRNGQGPQQCVPDAKLIGAVRVSADDAPDAWWGLVRARLDALGLTDYKAALERAFGQQFATLDEALAFQTAGVRTFDTNGNGYVCAYELRGTRASLGDVAAYTFGIADDKHVGG